MQLPGMDTQLLALSDQPFISRSMGQKSFLINIQRKAPGNIKALLGFNGPDDPGTPGTAVVAQIHAKGDQSVRLHGIYHIRHQAVIGTVFPAEGLSGGFKELLLKSSGSKI